MGGNYGTAEQPESAEESDESTEAPFANRLVDEAHADWAAWEADY
jgi:hypothetical protein